MSIGFYSKGCGQGFVQLPESGPSWQAMRLSRNRNWGHPELVNFLVGLSQAAQQAGWRGLYIGDMSQPRGGPMTSGHASHQLGLDADIWMLPPSSLNLSPAQRESISSESITDRRGVGLTNVWNGGHMSIMRAAARDPRVERIFVDPVAKVAMCQMERGDRSWLRKVRPINAHNYHFHVRLSCPRGSICDRQDPPPRATAAPRPPSGSRTASTQAASNPRRRTRITAIPGPSVFPNCPANAEPSPARPRGVPVAVPDRGRRPCAGRVAGICGHLCLVGR
ncbi:penicillin-insensitive murein endopeptidase [Paracoccus aerius]